MKKSENIQITEFDKKANVHNMELLTGLQGDCKGDGRID